MMNLAMLSKYYTYKDSGEGWIDQVPAHWEIRKLKHLFFEKKHCKNMSLNCGAISFGKVVTKDDDKILESTKVSYQEVLAGEYLINPLNLNYDLISLRIALSEIDVVVSAGYIVIKEKQPIDKGYFKYLLHRYDVAYMKLLGSGVRQTISFKHIANSLLLYPPLEEQSSIANYLDKKTTQIDEAIAIKEQQIALLKERKQIIIQKAVTQGLDPNVPMKDSGVDWIGRIPEHWEVKRAKYIFDEIDERSKTGDEELLSVSHMTGVTPRSEKNVSMFMAEDYTGSKLCRENDLVINIMWAWMGALGVSDRVGIVSPSYGVFRQKMENIFNPVYLEYLLKSIYYVEYYNKVSTGLHSSRLRFYGHMLFAMKMGYPCYEEQNQIIAYLGEQTKKIDLAVDSQLAQIEKLKEYKTTLINSAVTGKIKVTPEMAGIDDVVQDAVEA
jgi:type I restriction enzyme, S subunit